MQALVDGFQLLVKLVFEIFVLVIFIRVAVQWHRFNATNPIIQFIAKITNPLINPVQKIIPKIGQLDVAALLIAYLLVFIKVTILLSLTSGTLFLNLQTLLYAVVDFVDQLINLFFFSIIIYVILGWINQRGSALYEVLVMIVDPVLNPLRGMVPPVGGFDISPIIALIGLKLISVIFSSAMLYYLIPMV
ncbi:MAG: hypothetical protein GKR77_02305 [Legionellales bacterium]|nr:hypothetical protein [Legionellales bacterium]